MSGFSYILFSTTLTGKEIDITKSSFNIGHIHLQNFHYIAQANKNQSWSIIDIIITVVFVHKT